MMHRILAAGLLAGLLAAAPTLARADNDAIQFFSDIHVTPDTPVHDAVCFFCSVRDDGTINHDVVVFFGSIDITGSARHDVVSLFGSVDAHDNASIDHDLVSIFGGLRLGENATVGHDAVAVFSSIQARPSATIKGNRVSISAILFWGPAHDPDSPHRADRISGPRAQPPLAAPRIPPAADAVDAKSLTA